jgi:hypothetical protein
MSSNKLLGVYKLMLIVIKFFLGLMFTCLTVFYGFTMRCALGTCSPYYEATLFSLLTLILGIGFLFSGIWQLVKTTNFSRPEGINASNLADNTDHHTT